MPWIHRQTRTSKQTGLTRTYYSIGWRQNGLEELMALGYVTEQEATRLLTIFKGKLAAGLVPPRPRRTGRGSSGRELTLGQYLDEVFLPGRQLEVAPATYASNCTSATALKATMATVPLGSVEFKHSHDHKQRRLNEGRSPGTIQQELYVLRLALELARDTRVIRAMPKLASISYEAEEQDFLEKDEEQALLRAMYLLGGWGYLAVLIGLNVGLRRGEIMTRGWEDIRWSDGPHGSLVVSAKRSASFKVKTRKTRTLPLSPELREELELAHASAGRPRRGWIFPGVRDPGRPRATFRYPLEKGCAAAGLRRLTPHTLRRTWATRMALAGVDRATLIKLGGWKDGKMLDVVYARVPASHAVEIMSQNGVTGRRPALSVAAK